MHCIVGLGNPESRYSQTRHNIGFQIADAAAHSLGAAFKKGRGAYSVAAGRISGKRVLIVKPLTYMNRSGTAVTQVMQYYDIPADTILVILDDIDLPFGTFRLRPRGGDAGNRGMRSIISETGTEDIPRFRFGIRNRKTIANTSSYVLSQFARREKKYLPRLIAMSEEVVVTWVTEGLDRAMDRFNGHHLELK